MLYIIDFIIVFFVNVLVVLIIVKRKPYVFVIQSLCIYVTLPEICFLIFICVYVIPCVPDLLFIRDCRVKMIISVRI